MVEAGWKFSREVTLGNVLNLLAMMIGGASALVAGVILFNDLGNSVADTRNDLNALSAQVSELDRKSSTTRGELDGKINTSRTDIVLLQQSVTNLIEAQNRSQGYFEQINRSVSQMAVSQAKVEGQLSTIVQQMRGAERRSEVEPGSVPFLGIQR